MTERPERRSTRRLATLGLPVPQLRMRLRSKLVVAMIFAALVPVLLVAFIAVGVILSSLEASLREDADRQLTVGLNLILRSIVLWLRKSRWRRSGSCRKRSTLLRRCLKAERSLYRRYRSPIQSNSTVRG